MTKLVNQFMAFHNPVCVRHSNPYSNQLQRLHNLSLNVELSSRLYEPVTKLCYCHYCYYLMTKSLSLITLVDVAERRGSGSDGSPTSSSSSRNRHERTTCKISVTDTESGQSQVYTSRDSFQDAVATSAGEHRDFFYTCTYQCMLCVSNFMACYFLNFATLD